VNILEDKSSFKVLGWKWNFSAILVIKKASLTDLLDCASERRQADTNMHRSISLVLISYLKAYPLM